jgi:hypothetical protein
MKFLKTFIVLTFTFTPLYSQEYDSTGFNAQTLLYKGEERFLANVKQLTFEGENAEAYLSFDETQIIFQSRKGNGDCDQIYIMNLDGSRKTACKHRQRTHDLLLLFARWKNDSLCFHAFSRYGLSASTEHGKGLHMGTL